MLKFLEYRIGSKSWHKSQHFGVCLWRQNKHKEINYMKYLFSSVQSELKMSVTSDSLWPHGLQHTRLPCPSPTPGAYSTSCPSSWWCHPTISSTVIPFSFCLQCFLSSGSFSNESVLHIRWSKYWNFCFSISTSNEYSGLISFRVNWLDHYLVQEALQSLLPHHSSKTPYLWCSTFSMVQLWHPYVTAGKIIPLTKWSFVGKVVSAF